MSNSTITEEMSTLTSWVEEHRGDVDRAAFQDACWSIALRAAGDRCIRVPHGLSGLTLLDFADALCRTHTALSLAARFPRLPGAQAFAECAEEGGRL